MVATEVATWQTSMTVANKGAATGKNKYENGNNQWPSILLQHRGCQQWRKICSIVSYANR